jgi:hypothetical protein
MDELDPPSPPPNVEPLIEPSRVDPMTDRTLADKGTKMYVIFFLLVVPALGFGIVVVLFWTLLKEFLSA